jgi:hypothetical protein
MRCGRCRDTFEVTADRVTAKVPADPEPAHGPVGETAGIGTQYRKSPSEGRDVLERWIDLGAPRSNDQIAQLIDDRPSYWEFLLLAGAVFCYVARLEPKYVDHDNCIGRVSAVELDTLQTMEYLVNAIGLLQATIEQEMRVFEPEAQRRAFGGPAEPGDPLRILTIARHIATGYEAMLDWAASIRGLRTPEGLRVPVELAARMADQPIAQVRQFVDELLRDVETALPRLASGETVHIPAHLKLSMDESVYSAYRAAISEASDSFGSDRGRGL